MKTIIITGGIATGKSTVLRYLRDTKESLVFFDADAAVSDILDSGRVAQELVQIFGPGSITQEGSADRSFLRNLIFSDTSAKKKLESLLHPKIRQECLALREDTFKNKGAVGFIVDIPLFFENNFDIAQDLVVVVSLTPETQLQRLSERNGFDETLARAILLAQLPLSEKEKKADIILWNEGPKDWLYQQIDLLYSHHLI